MLGFEGFDLRAWVDGILVRWDDVEEPAKHHVKSKSPSPLVKRVLMTGVTVAATLAAASQFATMAAIPTASSFVESSRGSGDVVPVGYWSMLVSEMGSWKPIADEDLPPLPALI